MPPEPEKNMEFADETINSAGAIAAGEGKTNFEKQKEAIEQSILQSDTVQNEKPQAPHVVIKNLRTFQGDVAEAIKHQNASVVSIALAENEKQVRQEKEGGKPFNGISQNEIARIMGKKLPPGLPVEKVPVPIPTPIPVPVPQKVVPKPAPVVISRREGVPEPKIRPEVVRNTVMVAISIVLIIVGIGSVVGFYILQQKPKEIAVQAPVDQTIVAFNTKEEIVSASISRDTLLTKLSAIRNTGSRQEGTITYIALTTTEAIKTVPISTNNLFTILRTDIPGVALRAFDNQFMLGMYEQNGNQPFLLIKLNSFDNAFAGMLTWEKTLNNDLGAIFSARSIPITSQIIGTNGSSTSNTQVVNVDAQVNGTFEDITIQNKDARVLKNVRGDDIILYSFLDDKTLLITANKQVFHDILNKYIALKLIR